MFGILYEIKTKIKKTVTLHKDCTFPVLSLFDDELNFRKVKQKNYLVLSYFYCSYASRE